jgi:hypothetical protein
MTSLRVTAKEDLMRFALILSAVLALLFSGPGFAADADPWFTYTNPQDRFSLNLPAQPNVEAFTYTSEYRSPWKARRYTVDYQGFTYRMTAVDMSNSVLPPNGAVRPGFERRGAIFFAAAQLRRTGKLTLDTYDQLQVIPGLKLEIVLADGRTNIVELHTHYHMLYILEVISPKDEVPGYDVQSSLELIGPRGDVPRYVDDGFPGTLPVASAAPPAAGAPPAGWTAYANRQDRFAVYLPGQPKLEAFTYMSAAGSPWKSRRYTAERDGRQYTMTVIDTSTTILTPDNDAYRNTARPGSEKAGAMAYAAWNLRKTGTVTVDSYAERQVIPGQKLEITLPDGRRNKAEIFQHFDFVYILEEVSPRNAAAAYDVHSSLAMLDANGNVPRYRDNNLSFPEFAPQPAPAARGGGAGGGRGAAGGGRGAAGAGAGGDAP